MPSFRLDFEEWHELFLAAMAVPEEEQRPCLKTAILGLTRVLTECHRENPDEVKPVLDEGLHHCEKAECQKALQTAIEVLAGGADPFDARATDEDDVQARLIAIEEKIDLLVAR